ncbi:MAG: hypothetical protein ACLQU3_03810 [Limisphaerales bacterium]
MIDQFHSMSFANDQVPGQTPPNLCSGLVSWVGGTLTWQPDQRTKKANELLKKLGNTLFGKKVNTSAAGDPRLGELPQVLPPNGQTLMQTPQI